MPRRVAHLSALPIATVVALAPAAAFSQDEGAACLSAYENTQLRRMKGEFRAARDAARTCSQATCRDVLRDDCLQWLAELDRTVPSVVFEVRSERGEEVDVRVLLDGELLVSRLDGAPIELDPGAHTLRFEMSGRAPVEQQVLLNAGEKLRTISATFEGEPSRSARPPAPETPPAMYRPISSFAYVAGWVALGSGAAFAALAISGSVERDRLQDTCAPFCSSDEMSGVRLRYALADISLGLGVVSLGTAAVLYLTRPEVPRGETRAAPAGSLDVTVDFTEQGPFVGARGRF